MSMGSDCTPAFIVRSATILKGKIMLRSKQGPHCFSSDGVLWVLWPKEG